MTSFFTAPLLFGEFCNGTSKKHGIGQFTLPTPQFAVGHCKIMAICNGTSKKRGIGQFTLPTLQFAVGHYKIMAICRNTPRSLFYSFLSFRDRRCGEMFELPSCSTSVCLVIFAITRRCRQFNAVLLWPTVSAGRCPLQPRTSGGAASPALRGQRPGMKRDATSSDRGIKVFVCFWIKF